MNANPVLEKVVIPHADGPQAVVPSIRKSGVIVPIGTLREASSPRARRERPPAWLPKLAINQRIIPEIIAECDRFKEFDIETGSALIGRASRNAAQRHITVDVSLPPGEGLDRQRTSFSQASQLHDQLLTWYQRNDASIRYLGDWHRHESMPQPSHGDLMTAKSVLADPDFGVDELLVVIACHYSQRWSRPRAERWFSDALRKTRFDPDEYSLRFFYLASGMKRFAELSPQTFLHERDEQSILCEQWYMARDGRLDRELQLMEAVGFTPQLRISGKTPNLSFLFSHPSWKTQIELTTGKRYPRQRPGGFVREGTTSRGFSPRSLDLDWNPECNLVRFLVAALAAGHHGRRS